MLSVMYFLVYLLFIYSTIDQANTGRNGREVTVDEVGYYCPCVRQIIEDGSAKLKLNVIRVNKEAILGNKPNDYELEVPPEPAEAEPLPSPPLKPGLKVPFLAALVQVDDDSQIEPEMKCSVLILSPTEIITASNCANMDQIQNLQINSGSPSWKDPARTHKVTEVSKSPYDQVLITMKVDPPFHPSLLPEPPLTFRTDSSWNYATDAGYGPDDTYDVRAWTTRPMQTGNPLNVDFRPPDESCMNSSRFLVTNCNEVVGLSYCEGFYNLGAKNRGKYTYPIYPRADKIRRPCTRNIF